MREGAGKMLEERVASLERRQDYFLRELQKLKVKKHQEFIERETEARRRAVLDSLWEHITKSPVLGDYFSIIKSLAQIN